MSVHLDVKPEPSADRRAQRENLGKACRCSRSVIRGRAGSRTILMEHIVVHRSIIRCCQSNASPVFGLQLSYNQASIALFRVHLLALPCFYITWTGQDTKDRHDISYEQRPHVKCTEGGDVCVCDRQCAISTTTRPCQSDLRTHGRHHTQTATYSYTMELSSQFAGLAVGGVSNSSSSSSSMSAGSRLKSVSLRLSCIFYFDTP